MLATQSSLANSLRWLRRLMVLLLILANFMMVNLADAGHGFRISPARFAIPSVVQQP